MSKSFFPLRLGEALTLAFLIVFSIVSFLPLWDGVALAGMAMFGWLMAVLMVLSPALALLAMSRRDRRR